MPRERRFNTRNGSFNHKPQRRMKQNAQIKPSKLMGLAGMTGGIIAAFIGVTVVIPITSKEEDSG